MHAAADLLVEEDRADRALDAEVRADPELADAPCAVVGVQRTAQVLVAALGAGSRGPVKTSPLGMLRRPSELTQVRPPTSSRRSVPGAWMRSSRALRNESISRAWNARSSPHERTGSG